MDPTTQRLMMAASSGTEGINWTDHGFSLRTSGWALNRIVYANNLATPAYYAAGTNGTIARSTDGVTWTYNTTVATAMGSNNFYGIAYDSTNNILIACGDLGRIYRSTDGINWTSAAQSPFLALYSVRFLNGAFWIVGEAGTILKSTTGASGTWATQSPVAAHATYAINDIGYGAISGTTDKWMYAGDAGIVAYSANGTGTWLNVRSAQTTNPNNWYTNTIIFVPPSGFATTGEFLLAGSRDGTGGFSAAALYRSNNATTALTLLTVASSTSDPSFKTVYYNGSASAKFVVVSDSSLYTSADSTTWTKQPTYPTLVSTNDLISDGTTTYYVGATPSTTVNQPNNSVVTSLSSGFIHKSNSACTSYTPLIFSHSFNNITYSSNLGKYLAVSNNGNLVATSTDGNTWTPYFSYCGSDPMGLSCVTALGSSTNKFAGSGSSSTIGAGVYVSSDGINWTNTTTSFSLNSMAYGSAGIIGVLAVSTANVYRSTDDGATWSALGTGITGTYYTITYTAVVGYFAVGRFGVNKYSADGLTWTAGAVTSASTNLAGAAIQSGTNTYIASATNGNIYYSTAPASGWTTNAISSGTSVPAVGVTNKKSIVATNISGGIYSGKVVGGLISRTSGVTTGLYGVASSPGKVVVVGANGVILSSP
jgi:hypothetical protein